MRGRTRVDPAPDVPPNSVRNPEHAGSTALSRARLPGGESTHQTAWFGAGSHTGPLGSEYDTATWSGVMTGVRTFPCGDQATFVHGDSALTVSGIGSGAGA